MAANWFARPERLTAVRVVLRLSCWNALIDLWLWRACFGVLPDDAGALATLQVGLAILSTAVIGGLLVTVPALVLGALRTPWLLLLPIVGLGWLAWNTFVYGDAIVFGLYGYHINPMIWDVVLGDGAADSVAMGDGTQIRAVVEISVMALISALACIACWWPDRRPSARPATVPTATTSDPGSGLREAAGAATEAIARQRLDGAGLDTATGDATEAGPAEPTDTPAAGAMAGRRQPGRAWLTWSLVAALLLVVAADKLWLAVAWSQHTPSATIPRLAMGERYHGPQPSAGLLPAAPQAVSWPRGNAAATALVQHPRDVIVLVMEGTRGDQLNPTTMPNLTALAREAVVAENHRSSSHSTRYALFSLFYGLYPSYFPAFLASGQSPVLLDVLQRSGYATLVAACTNLRWPEFRQTIFSQIDPATIHDTWDDAELGGRIGRDRAVTDLVVDRINNTPATQPLFAFGFYDGTHFPYEFREQDAVHQPVADPLAIDMIKLSRERDPALLAGLEHRYRNSHHRIDRHIAEIVDALKASGRWDNSILVVLGDHGEAFGGAGDRPGHIIHNGAWSRDQLASLLVVRLPGVPGQRLGRLTSHLDLSVTLFDYLGIAVASEDHSLGTHLLAAEGPAARVVGGWDEMGVVDEAYALRMGIGTGNRWLLQATDAAGIPVANPAVVIERFSADLERIRAGMLWFSADQVPKR